MCELFLTHHSIINNRKLRIIMFHIIPTKSNILNSIFVLELLFNTGIHCKFSPYQNWIMKIFFVHNSLYKKSTSCYGVLDHFFGFPMFFLVCSLYILYNGQGTTLKIQIFSIFFEVDLRKNRNWFSYKTRTSDVILIFL